MASFGFMILWKDKFLGTILILVYEWILMLLIM